MNFFKPSDKTNTVSYNSHYKMLLLTTLLLQINNTLAKDEEDDNNNAVIPEVIGVVIGILLVVAFIYKICSEGLTCGEEERQCCPGICP